MSNVDIPLTVEGRVSFGSVIYELVRRVCEVKVPEGEVTLQLNRIYKRIFANAEFGGEHDNFRMFMVVKRVQRRWRNIFKHKAYSMRRSVKASRSVVPAAADVMVS